MLADWLPGILMLVLFALETPISFAIAISALSFFLIDDGIPLKIFAQKMVSATDSYPLLSTSSTNKGSPVFSRIAALNFIHSIFQFKPHHRRDQEATK